MHLKDPEFPVVAGIIQFEPDSRQVNGQTVRDIKIREFGTQRDTSVTVWPELAHVPLEAGDFVVIQGKRRIRRTVSRDGEPREYRNLDARTLRRVGVEQPDRF